MVASFFAFLLLATVHAGRIGVSIPKAVDGSPIVYMDGAGDSLSVAYSAVLNGLPNGNTGEGSCPNGGMTGRIWAAELNSTVCPVSSSPAVVKSFAEQVFCDSSRSMRVQNHAVSGADMLNNFKTQSDQILSSLNSAASGRRQVIVFMGHNDLCSGQANKASTNGCGGNADKDASNYCFTQNGAFEREFRNGLDSLIQAQNTTIAVVAPARVSQLCLVRNLQMCQPLLTIPRAANCGNAWTGLAGICLPLTQDCSDTRVQDMYNYEKAYVDTLLKVVQDYNNIQTGGTSPPYTYNGKTVGGKAKAAGVNLIFSTAIWQSQLSAPLVSCCDCFHASAAGQQRLANAAFSGVTCSTSTPCCSDSSTSLNNGKCQDGTPGVITDGRYIEGILL